MCRASAVLASWHEITIVREFPALKALEEAAPIIQREYATIRDETSDYDTVQDEHKLHAGGWDWHSLMQKGVVSDKFRQQCPVTSHILESKVDLMTGVPFGYAFFSKIQPGSRKCAAESARNLSEPSQELPPIMVHATCEFDVTWPWKVRFVDLRVFPQPNRDLAGAGGAKLRVGNEWREWTVGECLVFDDCYGTFPRSQASCPSSRVTFRSRLPLVHKSLCRSLCCFSCHACVCAALLCNPLYRARGGTRR